MAEPRTISIEDVEFQVSMPYDVGHTITEAEAKALNQTRRENLGNNFRKQVKAFNASEEGAATSVDELQQAFAELDQNYVFTIANVGASRKLDPVEREARKIARDYLRQELDKAGRKIGTPPSADVTQEDWDATIEAEVDRLSQDEQVVKMAKDIVKARSRTAGLQLGALGLANEGGAETSEAAE